MAQIILYIIRPEKYFEGVLKILEKIGDKKVIYVTTNKPYVTLMNAIEKTKIDAKNLFVIDCISTHIGEKPSKDSSNVIFLDSPQSLTLINIAISQTVSEIEGPKVLLLDSLSTLLLYNDANTIGRFSNFLISKMRSNEVDVVILALESDLEKDILKKIEAFADEVKKGW